MKYSNELMLNLYEQLLGSRLFEEKLIDIYAMGKVPGHIHSGVGEEAVYVGALATRKEGDYFKFTHRNVSAPNLVGMDYNTIFSEIMGKETGNTKGRGGINHLAQLKHGIIGMAGSLGCDLAIAVGSAYSIKMSETDNITYVFFGDGTTSRGSFHEALNWASAWKLPVLFIVNNNQWSISTHISEVCNVENPGADRAAGYGIPSKVVDGTDVLEVYKASKELADGIREGKGPAILEAKCYRWRGHFEGDQAQYRDQKITDEWRKKDCLEKLEKYILKENIITEDEILSIKQEVNGELDKAIAFAESSPNPNPEDIFDGLFA